MKSAASLRHFIIAFLIALVLFAVAVQAQTPESDPIRRPRVAGESKAKASTKFQGQATQSQTPAHPAETGTKPEKPSTSPVSTKPEATESRSSTAAQREESIASRRISPNRIRLRRTEAERLMKVRPLPTAMTLPSLDYVTLAALLVAA